MGHAKIIDIDFAVDVVIFAETLEVLLYALDKLIMGSKYLGLKFSWIKTRIIQKSFVLFDGIIILPPPVTMEGEHVFFVDSFVYLGGVLGSGGRYFLDLFL